MKLWFTTLRLHLSSVDATRVTSALHQTVSNVARNTRHCVAKFYTAQRFMPGVGNLFAITGRMNCALSLAGRKINRFYPKILPSCNCEEALFLLTYYLGTCLSWSFVLTRCVL